jgi:hypothetical protein
VTLLLALFVVALGAHHRRSSARHRLACVASAAVPARRSRLMARVRRTSSPPVPTPIPTPLLLELLAALLESGAPPAPALRHVATALARDDDPRALPLRQLAAGVEQGVVRTGDQDPGRRPKAAEPDAGLVALADIVRLSAVAGLPPAALVRRGAVEERRRSSAVRRRAIRRLEVLLVLPVGLCLLPAFVFLGIVPVVVDLFGS